MRKLGPVKCGPKPRCLHVELASADLARYNHGFKSNENREG